MNDIISSHQLQLCEQTIDLLPQRAIYWQEQKTLIVADVHLGKAQTFQRAGLAVPGTSLIDDLERLEKLITTTSAQRLLVLGDFVHHRSGLTDGVREKIIEWCNNLQAELVVIIGNHDRPNRKFLAEMPIVLQDSSWQFGPFEFAHEQIITDKFCFFGHLHPVVNLQSHLRLPVFAFYNNYCVLPAFSYFTGGYNIDIRDTTNIFIPVEGEYVLPLKPSP